MKCPRCGKLICDCLLEDPEYLALKVGKKLRLVGKRAPGLTTPKSGATSEASDGEDTDERYSPTWLIEKARLVLGGIDCDPASSEVANRTVKATTYYSQADNGLNREWHGRVWLNFPWSHGFTPWAAKFAEVFSAGRMTAGLLLSPGEMTWCIFRLPPGGSLWFPRNDRRPKFLDGVTNKWIGTRYPPWLAYYGPEKRKFPTDSAS
jgi:hypothetical protein